MTVKELREKLGEYPDDLLVVAQEPLESNDTGTEPKLEVGTVRFRKSGAVEYCSLWPHDEDDTDVKALIIAAQ